MASGWALGSVGVCSKAGGHAPGLRQSLRLCLHIVQPNGATRFGTGSLIIGDEHYRTPVANQATAPDAVTVLPHFADHWRRASEQRR